MNTEIQRVVVITGAAGGIGRATADIFSRNGWYVIGMDRQEPKQELSGVSELLIGDVSGPSTIEALRDFLRDHNIERVDALVNNAAMQINKRLMDTTAAEWDQVMTNNVRSVALASQTVVPYLGEGGAVVNISSVHAVATSKGIAAYASSKGALLALTRAMALEFAEAGVRVNAVLPGAVDTQMLREGLGRRPEDGDQEEAIRALGVRTPLGRVGNPHEVGEAIYFLADSQRSSFITGQALVVDGGATTRLSTE